jgi:hypothetical protein
MNTPMSCAVFGHKSEAAKGLGVAGSKRHHAEGRQRDAADAHKVEQVPVTWSWLWQELP